MATKPFHYQEPFPLGPDTTKYRLLTKEYVKVENWNGHEMLVIDPEALTVLSNAATTACSFQLRREHNEMVAKILHDPEASENDKFVALTMLRNAEVAAKGVLPFCHRHIYMRRIQGAAGVDRLRRRGEDFARRIQDLHREQPALFAERAADNV